MIGSKRSRRLGALLAGAALVIAVTGCTVGTTSILARQSSGVAECKVGSSTGLLWVTAPGTQDLRFEVLNSDATEPLEAIAVLGIQGGPSFGTVWDGTKSTGPKQVRLTTTGESRLVGLVLAMDDGFPADQTNNTTWAVAALDANGKDVGFTSCSG
jgi:hypothetical protein